MKPAAWTRMPRLLTSCMNTKPRSWRWGAWLAPRLWKSNFYDRPDTGADDATVVAQMKSICDEFETYGYRRVDAELRHRGLVVNAKKVRRLMREHALNPQPRRRFIATTDSDHNDPICPNLTTTMTLDGPNQLWVADITYVAITTSFV